VNAATNHNFENLFEENLNEKISDRISRSVAYAQHCFGSRRSFCIGQSSPSPAGTAEVERVVVQSQEMDITREQIVPSLGATRYTVGPDRLDSQSQGENAPFNQTLLRFPGVAQDSFGQLHVRGEHANLQYRIDDVLLPESIPGFGQIGDPLRGQHFAHYWRCRTI
jgi:hypothetical protein